MAKMSRKIENESKRIKKKLKKEKSCKNDDYAKSGTNKNSSIGKTFFVFVLLLSVYRSLLFFSCSRSFLFPPIFGTNYECANRVTLFFYGFLFGNSLWWQLFFVLFFCFFSNTEENWTTEWNLIAYLLDSFQDFSERIMGKINGRQIYYYFVIFFFYFSFTAWTFIFLCYFLFPPSFSLCPNDWRGDLIKIYILFLIRIHFPFFFLLFSLYSFLYFAVTYFLIEVEKKKLTQKWKIT